MRRLAFGLLGVGALLTAIATVASAGDAQDEAIKKDRKDIEGTWRVVVIEINGSKSQEEDIGKFVKKLTVVNGSDGTWSLRADDRETNKWTSTIDPMKRPKTIDLTQTEGEEKGHKQLGIYELGKNTLKLCFAAPGKKRPTEFSSTPGSEHFFITFLREKRK